MPLLKALAKILIWSSTSLKIQKPLQAKRSFNFVLSITTWGQTITEEQNGADIFDSSEWRLDGNSIIFGSDEEEVAFLITSLKETEMNLQSEANSSTFEFSDIQIELNQKYTVKPTK